MTQAFTLCAVVQKGRLAYEALLLASSLAYSSPGVALTFLEPQPGPLWSEDPRTPPHIRDQLQAIGARIVPFENNSFGEIYPHGNKIEGLEALPPDTPFVFLDTDTLVTSDLSEVPFDFGRPSASLRRTGTWPKGKDIDGIWRALYARFDLHFESSLDTKFPVNNWQRYLYFNAGFFYGADPCKFGALFARMSAEIWHDPGSALAGQALTPWLDQIVLPLVIHKLGGSRDALPEGFMDAKTTFHYRTLPLLFARAPSATIEHLRAVCAPHKIKRILKEYPPFHQMIYRGKGDEIREMFAGRRDLDETLMRKELKAAGLWLR